MEKSKKKTDLHGWPKDAVKQNH